MTGYALLMVLFFAEGVENPRPQMLPQLSPIVVEEFECEERVDYFNAFLEASKEAAEESGQVFPDWRITCDPIPTYEPPVE